MLKLISFLTVVIFILAACSVTTDTARSNIFKNEKIEAYFYVGGFENGRYVKIDNNILSYGVRSFSSDIKWVNIPLKHSDLLHLEKTFQYYDIQEWDKRYDNPFIQDGVSWVIKYKSHRFEVNSRGSNSYPPNFKEVMSVISHDLLKGRVFQ